MFVSAKYEDVAGEGEVLYHGHIGKDPEEVAARRAEMNRRKAEKEARKHLQRQNVQKKKYPRVSTGGDDGDGDGNDGHPLDSVKVSSLLFSSRRPVSRQCITESCSDMLHLNTGAGR